MTLYEDKFYNKDRKIEYLDTKNKGTREINKRIFKVSQPLEEQLGKDLADFTKDELAKLFYRFRAATKASSAANVGYVYKYFEWCLENGYKSGLNPLDFVDTEWKQQFANAISKQLWTDFEIEEIISGQRNANDKVIVSLLFSGIKGADNSEITNLDVNHINRETNELTLIDDKHEDGVVRERTIQVSKDLIDLCVSASLDLIYEKMNGMPDENTRAKTAPMINNSYVVKLAKTRTINTENAGGDVVYRRLTKIADIIGESQFTPTNIMRSGQLSIAKDIYLETGSLTDEDIKKIAIQFGEDPETSLYRLKTSLLNIETIKSTYGLS